MQLLSFSTEMSGRQIVRSDIPEALRGQAESWREAMLEKLYDLSNELIELALQEEPIPEELMSRPTMRRILELIDGSRPLSEILGHSHISEFLTAKLLFKMHAPARRYRSIARCASCRRDAACAARNR